MREREKDRQTDRLGEKTFIQRIREKERERE